VEGPEDAAIDHNRSRPRSDDRRRLREDLRRDGEEHGAGIGRVLKALDRAKLERDTLVIFTSDNGGERYSVQLAVLVPEDVPVRGGTRVPAMVRWTGRIPAGQVTAQAAITMDWTATILAATGTAPDSGICPDGEKPVACVHGERPVHDRELFWRITASTRRASDRGST